MHAGPCDRFFCAENFARREGEGEIPGLVLFSPARASVASRGELDTSPAAGSTRCSRPTDRPSMSPLNLVLRRPLTVIIAIIALALGAGVAIQRMARDVFPPLGIPTI